MIQDTNAPDLLTCNREPIHIPGSIQPHGFLLALRPPEFTVVQASANVTGLLGTEPGAVLGRPVDEVLPALGPRWRELLAKVPERGSLPLRRLQLDHRAGQPALSATAHRSGELVLLEIEAQGETGDDVYEALHPLVGGFALELQSAATLGELGAIAARMIRELTGFDRVLVYQFDDAWNGTVIAEDRNEVLPSYLDLRFPADDIPEQARELYRLNRHRLIADAAYEPVPILAATEGPPLDLRFASLRSVSPVHLEYMRNMGTGASMSVSLLPGGELWGLICCHHEGPRWLSAQLRTACDLVGQMVALQIAAKQHAAEAGHRMQLKMIESRLLAYMAASERFIDGLVANPDDLLRLADAKGAAILHAGGCALVGETPPEDVVRGVADWLRGQQIEVFSTDSLARELPGAEACKDTGSGVLAVAISEIHASYVLWFRPEMIRTVTWGGDPRKAAAADMAGMRLHPRQSFEKWKETVRLRSLPWQAVEIDAVKELRNAIVGIVLRRAEELAELSQELARSNKELEAFSYSVSHDLRAPFRHIVGYAELLREYEGDRLSARGSRFLATITESAFAAGKLVDNLLDFSRMGRVRLTPIRIDMERLVAEVRRQLEPETRDRLIDWQVASLEPASGDPVMLRLALENLVSNALKYTRPRSPAVIGISSEPREHETVYTVRDNGVGFDMAYVGKLFGVFQRLHRIEEFEGTGIGLANVRRIVERHGGRVWAEAEVDHGAVFHFALPKVATG